MGLWKDRIDPDDEDERERAADGGSRKQGFITNGTMGPSRTVEWGTPTDLFDALNAELGPFDIDAAADGEHIAKCEVFITPEQDALKSDWGPVGSRAFVNPPYGPLMAPFMAKAAQQAAQGRLVVAVIPCRTDTRWWRDSIMLQATEVRLIQGRLKYENWEGGELTSSVSAPFPSCVIIFTPQAHSTNQTIGPHFGLVDRQGEWLARPQVDWKLVDDRTREWWNGFEAIARSHPPRENTPEQGTLDAWLIPEIGE